ncbi:VOC family protein [Streptomyces malaysiensis]
MRSGSREPSSGSTAASSRWSDIKPERGVRRNEHEHRPRRSDHRRCRAGSRERVLAPAAGRLDREDRDPPLPPDRRVPGPRDPAGRGACPPKWPDGDSQQMHIDLTTDDLAAADRLALDAGARRLNPTDDVDPAAQNGGRVYASPAGHPFCLRSA